MRARHVIVTLVAVGIVGCSTAARNDGAHDGPKASSPDSANSELGPAITSTMVNSGVGDALLIALSFGVDGKSLLSAHSVQHSKSAVRLKSVVRHWNVEGNLLLGSGEVDGTVRVMSVSHDGLFVITAGYGKVCCWSLPDLALVESVAWSGQVADIRCSPYSDIVALNAAGPSVAILSVPTLRHKATLPDSETVAVGLCFLDRHRVAGGDMAGRVRVWDITSGALLTEWQADDQILTTAAAGDGNLITVSGNFWRRWDTRNRALVAEEKITPTGMCLCRWEGDLLAAQGITWFDDVTYYRTAWVLRISDGLTVATIDHQRTTPVFLAISRNGLRVAAAPQTGGKVSIWNLPP